MPARSVLTAERAALELLRGRAASARGGVVSVRVREVCGGAHPSPCEAALQRLCQRLNGWRPGACWKHAKGVYLLDAAALRAWLAAMT
jgi:hypothetical protein